MYNYSNQKVPNEYHKGDRIRMTPDPYTWSSPDEEGEIIGVSDGVYEVKWDSGTVQALTHYYLDSKCTVISSKASSVLEGPAPCSHEMKKYLGLSESFNYCSKCDYQERLK